MDIQKDNKKNDVWHYVWYKVNNKCLLKLWHHDTKKGITSITIQYVQT